MADGFTYESFRGELQAVLARHADLEDARIAALLIDAASRVAARRKLDIEIEAHPDGVATVGFPDGEALAMLGGYKPGDWLDEMTVDVETYTHIQTGVPGDRDD